MELTLCTIVYVLIDVGFYVSRNFGDVFRGTCSTRFNNGRGINGMRFYRARKSVVSVTGTSRGSCGKGANGGTSAGGGINSTCASQGGESTKFTNIVGVGDNISSVNIRTRTCGLSETNISTKHMNCGR